MAAQPAPDYRSPHRRPCAIGRPLSPASANATAQVNWQRTVRAPASATSTSAQHARSTETGQQRGVLIETGTLMAARPPQVRHTFPETAGAHSARMSGRCLGRAYSMALDCGGPGPEPGNDGHDRTLPDRGGRPGRRPRPNSYRRTEVRVYPQNLICLEQRQDTAHAARADHQPQLSITHAGLTVSQQEAANPGTIAKRRHAQIRDDDGRT